jgi:hypothetical protein
LPVPQASIWVTPASRFAASADFPWKSGVDIRTRHVMGIEALCPQPGTSKPKDTLLW